MSEPAASRALYRGFLFLIVAIGIALLVRELIWVLVQLFIAAIVAASMSPIVDAFTNSTRARRLRWRPSRICGSRHLPGGWPGRAVGRLNRAACGRI